MTEIETDNKNIISPNSHFIVIGNEKGGAGKTTTAMHIITSLLHFGFSVGSIDLDSRQLSLSRYIENRRDRSTKEGFEDLLLPSHAIVKRSPFNTIDDAVQDERERLCACMSKLSQTNDFVVIDTPGSDTAMSQIAHSFADTVITPINDSFVDLDVLAKFDSETLDVVRPGVFSEMIWEQKLNRAKRTTRPLDWIVIRNRLSNIDAKNKRNMAIALEKLSKRIGFRIAQGFGERVIFRELFLKGLTLLDIIERQNTVSINMSHIAARRELRYMLEMLNIPKVNVVLGLQPNGSPKTKRSSISLPA